MTGDRHASSIPKVRVVGEMGIDRILTVPEPHHDGPAVLHPGVRLPAARPRQPGLGGSSRWGALASTDWIDGYVARRFNQRSNFGKMYDPSVDRLLMATAIVSIIIYGEVPLWYCWTS